MSQPYIGEIRMFAGNFAPVGWAFCDGSLQSISQNNALFALLGTTYGGDGQTTFALPNLLGRIPIHFGTSNTGASYAVGAIGGAETVTLTQGQMPVHAHQWSVMSGAGTADKEKLPGGYLANGPLPVYGVDSGPLAQLGTSMVGPAGNSQPHENMAPFLTINFILALFGVFPSQN
jgi:microcystin-dependent protein